jgi:DNA-binding LytR/AlgR family response regulator
MLVLIIEDEKPAAEKLQKALLACDPSIKVQEVVSSIQDAVSWLEQHPPPEVIFMDIELSDGLSFKIFEKTTINCPVIFTTAYDDYWQEAFEHNSIDYLLKPIKQQKLEAALKKYEKLKQHFSANYQKMLSWEGKPPEGGFKKRFLVKRGADYISIKTEDIAYFYAAHKLVCMVDNKGQKFILDQSLSDIEAQLDAGVFYRVNRKYLINMTAIRRIKTYPKSKLLLEVEPPLHEEIVISQENVSAFKQWMGQ